MIISDIMFIFFQLMNILSVSWEYRDIVNLIIMGYPFVTKSSLLLCGTLQIFTFLLYFVLETGLNINSCPIAWDK